MIGLIGETVTVEYNKTCYHGRLYMKNQEQYEVCDDNGSWLFYTKDINSVDDRIISISHKRVRV